MRRNAQAGRPAIESPTVARAQQLYEDLLADVGARAPLLPDLVVAHWPHVGRAYAGLMIVGQAVYGWPDDYAPSRFQRATERAQALHTISQRGMLGEPMSWLATSPVRGSPFWSVVRQVTETLEPGSAPWFDRLAWANLYPLAPDQGNPGGELRAVQDPHVGPLIGTMAEMLEARPVIALVGP